MSLFSRSRNAVAKAGWFSLHVLGWPRPSNIPPERPTWTKEVPPERRKVLDRIFNVSPDPISKPRGFTPEELLCDPYPGAQASSMAQQSDEWGDDREVTDHYARRDAAERTLSRKGYTWRGGEEWKPPIGQAPEWLGETLEDRHRRVGAAVVLNALGWRYLAGEWLEPPPKPDTVTDNLRDAIACALDEDADPGDSLQWLRDWSEGDPDALAELESWRARRPA